MTGIYRCTSQVAIYLILIAAALPLTLIARAQQRTKQQHSSRTKSVTSKSKGIEWRTFRGPDNDFILEFPSEPRRVEDVHGSVTILRRYALASRP
jgi:hypothetical protein